ncbi:MAG: EAL domain-containing protein [Deltaproteobacteria bacterium]|nr:EAL domain-containing protein [Deltaproteobacteria bacterium]
MIGAEALLRWDNPELGRISPVRFIPLAEELGCIAPIGEWVLQQVCTQGKAWLDAGQQPITLAVNLSPLQFYQANIVETVQSILTKTGYPAQWLELEVTESALMHKEKETIERLHQLHDLGIRLALDDFGTGYSSLSYLKYFPLDQLKIDKSFVDDLPHGVNDCKMVTAIIQMGRGLGFNLLAEGVENEEQLLCLKELGCDQYQGYHFSQPVPAADFFALQSLHS